MRGLKSKKCSCCGNDRPLENYHYTDKKHKSRRSKCKFCENIFKQIPVYKIKQKEYARNRRKNEEFRKREVEIRKIYGSTIKGRANRLFLAARYRAKTANLEFTITQEIIQVILYIGVCQKTGIPFDFSSPQGTNFNPYAPSLDKKNPFKGYTIDNTQVVCNSYNLAKGQMNDEQFVNFCKIVVEKNK